MQGQKGKCKDKKENARTTQKAIPWIAASKSSDQKTCLTIERHKYQNNDCLHCLSVRQYLITELKIREPFVLHKLHINYLKLCV